MNDAGVARNEFGIELCSLLIDAGLSTSLIESTGGSYTATADRTPFGVPELDILRPRLRGLSLLLAAFGGADAVADCAANECKVKLD